MIETAQWRESAAAIASEGFCMLMCLDRGNGQPLEMWLRTNAGTVLTALVGSEPVPSLGPIWPEATIREREIHEMFGVNFDSDESQVPLLFGAGHPLSGTFPLLKRNLLRSRNEVAWPGTKDPADAGGSPSRRKALPVGVVPDMQSFEGDFL